MAESVDIEGVKRVADETTESQATKKPKLDVSPIQDGNVSDESKLNIPPLDLTLTMQASNLDETVSEDNKKTTDISTQRVIVQVNADARVPEATANDQEQPTYDPITHAAAVGFIQPLWNGIGDKEILECWCCQQPYNAAPLLERDEAARSKTRIFTICGNSTCQEKKENVAKSTISYEEWRKVVCESK